MIMGSSARGRWTMLKDSPVRRLSIPTGVARKRLG